MLEITKISNGFTMNERNYSFMNFDEKPFEIISESQVHVGTDDGIMLLDLSVKIDQVEFSNIEEFTNFLFNQV